MAVQCCAEWFHVRTRSQAAWLIAVYATAERSEMGLTELSVCMRGTVEGQCSSVLSAADGRAECSVTR